MNTNQTPVVIITADEVVKNSTLLIEKISLFVLDALSKDAHLPNITATILFFKVSISDINREFPSEVQALLRIQPTNETFSFELTSIDEDDHNSILELSSRYFDKLCSNANTLNIYGINLYSKNTFISPLKKALSRVRLDSNSISRLMPYIYLALDAELISLYRLVNTDMQVRARKLTQPV